MRFERIRSIRPLTKLMVKFLQDCYEREKNDLDPAIFYDPDLISGLLDRGLMVKVIKKGEPDRYRLTDLGHEYMQHYFGK